MCKCDYHLKSDLDTLHHLNVKYTFQHSCLNVPFKFHGRMKYYSEVINIYVEVGLLPEKVNMTYYMTLTSCILVNIQAPVLPESSKA